MMALQFFKNDFSSLSRYDFYYISISGDIGLSPVTIRGPSAIQSGQQLWIELACSFSFYVDEYNQLDLKWYFAEQEEPFLQWVPSSGRTPQTIGSTFRGRLVAQHIVSNVSHGYMTKQVIRVMRPNIHLSGSYTCKVATFTQEDATSHQLVIFEPGAGPFLSYSMLDSGQLNLSCSVNQVFPEPELHLSWHSEPHSSESGEMSTITVRRGLMYDITVISLLPPMLAHETVFGCFMSIPKTQFSLNRKTMYSPVIRDMARVSQISMGIKMQMKMLRLVLISVMIL